MTDASAPTSPVPEQGPSYIPTHDQVRIALELVQPGSGAILLPREVEEAAFKVLGTYLNAQIAPPSCGYGSITTTGMGGMQIYSGTI